MSELEYTKGDWYLEGETGLILSLPEGGDCPISVASVGGSQETLTPKTLIEMEANAHLIAQSPRMAEWLNKVAIKQGGWIYQADLNEAKDILAKAEGK